MIRDITLLAVALVFCGDPAFSQPLTPTASADNLGPIVVQIAQDLLDLGEQHASRIENCEMDRIVMNVEETGRLAVDTLEIAYSMIRIYALVSAPNDRVRVGRYLEGSLTNYRQRLDLQLKRLNKVLGASLIPAAVAVIGTRTKDNIRAALGILERTTLP